MIVRCDWCNTGTFESRAKAVRITAGAITDRPARVCDDCAKHFPVDNEPGRA